MSGRRIRAYPLAMATVFFLALTASAERRTGAVEAYGGFIFPAADRLERGLGTGFGLTWSLFGPTRLGAHFLSTGLQSRGQEQELLPGKLTLTPFLVFLRQDFTLSPRLTLHLLAGGGIVFARLREDIVTIPEVTISQHLPSSVALHAGAGIDIFFLENVSVFFQGGYLSCRAEGTTTVRDTNLGVSGQEFRTNLSFLQVHCGLAYYF